MVKKTSRRKRNQRMVYAVIILAVCGLILSSALVYLGSNAFAPNVNTGDQSNASAIASLEYQISQHESSLEKAPGNFYLLTELGNSYYQLGQVYSTAANDEKAKESFAKAVEPYGKALEVEPNDINVRVDRAVAAFWSDSYDLAEQEFTKAIELDPTHAKAHFNYGIFQYYGRNNSVEAIKNWNKVIELNPVDDPQLVATAREWITQAEAGMNELRGDPSQFNFEDAPAEDNTTEEGNSGN